LDCVAETVWFSADHARGAAQHGQLTVGIAYDDERRGVTAHDSVRFSVPADFHAHNDAIAAALLTLVGRWYPVVRFDFPMSTHCAELLAARYALTDIGPVDPSLAPREPGPWLGLGLSGGIDSMALWVTLTRLLAEPARVITSDYGGAYAFERAGFEQLPRDVTSATNLRRTRYERAGRFHAAAPLLFAEYLGLGALAGGYVLEDTNDAFGPVAAPSPARAGALLAGGVRDLQLFRCLHATATSLMLVVAGQDLLQGAHTASSQPGTSMGAMKALVLQELHARAGVPLPAWLDRPWRAPQRPKLGVDALKDLRLLLLIKWRGLAYVRGIADGLDRLDLSFLDALTLDFATRYDPEALAQLPPEWAARLPVAFAACGIGPYTQRDRQELALLRERISPHWSARH
jgi:hypothetical protein